jgi:hypothetical protein
VETCVCCVHVVGPVCSVVYACCLQLYTELNQTKKQKQKSESKSDFSFGDFEIGFQ